MLYQNSDMFIDRHFVFREKNFKIIEYVNFQKYQVKILLIFKQFITTHIKIHFFTINLNFLRKYDLPCIIFCAISV